MITRKDFLSSSEYWTENLNNIIVSSLVEYKENRGYSDSELAKELGVSKGYISQVFRGRHSFTFKTIVNLLLKIRKVPELSIIDLDEYIKMDESSTSGAQNIKSRENEYFNYFECNNEKDVINQGLGLIPQMILDSWEAKLSKDLGTERSYSDLSVFNFTSEMDVEKVY